MAWEFSKYGFGPEKMHKGFDKFLFGTRSKTKKLSTLTPDQEELLSLIKEGLATGEGPLKDIFGAFNEEEFNKGVRDPALKNFQENILPILQEKFVAGNQYGGSGMQREQNKAGVDLQSQLAQLLYQAQQGQKENRLAGLQTGLGVKGVENIHKPGTQGALKGFAQGALQNAGSLASAAVAG